MTFAAAALLAASLAAEPAPPSDCVACHEKTQPGVVLEWKVSTHAAKGVGCEACHGTAHSTPDDTAMAKRPGIATCRPCHEVQAAQFGAGKHSRAWDAVKALPTFHGFDASGPGGAAVCVTCHRIGIEEEEFKEVPIVGRAPGTCDSCHSRHTFAAAEARRPEACRVCHGSLQFDAWSQSKHGERWSLAFARQLPPEAAGPTCQGCHLPNGDHSVRTSWGSLGLRTEAPANKEWAADVAVVLRALGVADTSGALKGPRAAAFAEAQLVGFDRIDASLVRAKLTQGCRSCHTARSIREAFDARDGLVRQADGLTARAIRAVSGLYDAGVLPKSGPGPFPDLVKAASGSPVERRLATLFFDHRVKLLAHAFHNSAEYVRWISLLTEDVAEIERMAAELRAAARKR